MILVNEFQSYKVLKLGFSVIFTEVSSYEYMNIIDYDIKLDIIILKEFERYTNKNYYIIR